MILTGSEIQKEMEAGNINITHFNPENLNPNSYDITLGDSLMVLDKVLVDDNGMIKTHKDLSSGNDIPIQQVVFPFIEPKYTEISFEPLNKILAEPWLIAHNIPTTDYEKEAVLLAPGTVYLANSKESTVSHKYVPKLMGKSSIARKGISIHATAGYGDIGWGYPFLPIPSIKGTKGWRPVPNIWTACEQLMDGSDNIRTALAISSRLSRLHPTKIEKRGGRIL